VVGTLPWNINVGPSNWDSRRGGPPVTMKLVRVGKEAYAQKKKARRNKMGQASMNLNSKKGSPGRSVGGAWGGEQSRRKRRLKACEIKGWFFIRGKLSEPILKISEKGIFAKNMIRKHSPGGRSLLGSHVTYSKKKKES